jgi:hypothetical protein
VEYAFTQLAEDIDIERIFIFGRSLGGAVGIYVTSKNTYSVI